MTSHTADDEKRNEMYRANAQRIQSEKTFSDYGEYLESLDMNAVIDKFDEVSLSRITQLTNKSNQFNLTTRRYTLSEIKAVSSDESYIKLYGRLTDRFGDNGIVSVVIGRTENDSLHIDLWLMSCRVLKRDMEYAMLDRLTEICKSRGITRIYGYYFKTAKNSMVKNLFSDFGFKKLTEEENGNSSYVLEISGYQKKNRYIKINTNGGY